MSALSSYSGITTKIKAMESKRLTKKELIELASYTTLADVAGFLKRQPGYKDIFARVDEANIHREDMERIMIYVYYDSFIRLYKFANIKQKKYLKVYFRRFELSFIKSCLRKIFANNQVEKNIEDIKIVFEHYSKIDIAAAAGASSIEGLVKSLEGTEYFRCLKQVIDRESKTLFDYEIALDLYFFSNMWRKKNKNFKGIDLKIYKNTYGYKIDILNLQWIYRSKKYYDLSPADILAVIIPVTYKLKKEEVTQMVNAASVEEYSNILKNTHYGRLYPEIKGEDLEDIYIYLMDKIHRAGKRKYPYSLAIMDTFFYEKEYEINKIVTAVECIRYGMKKEDILLHIGLGQGGITQ